MLLAVFLVRPCLAKTDDSVSQQWLQWSTEKLTNDLGYGVTAPISNEIVASETGKYFTSVFVEGHRGQYGDYISPTIDNINIVHVGSAKAPYSVENLVAEHDETEADNQLKVLTTTQDLSYTADREPTEEMEQHFYAVIPQTSAGVGQAQLDHVILGQLKAVPFAESFVEGGLSASGWVTDADVSQYGTQWYILSDDEEQTSQDGDGGFALCYNGNYSSNYHYGDLITPKMAVRGTGDYRLTFHVYHGTTTYATVPPTLVVMCNIDDNDYFEVLDTIDVTEGEAGWMKYEATIPVTSANHYMKFCFRGLMNSMYERIWIDNILVESLIPTGLELSRNAEHSVRNVMGGIAVTGHKGERIQVYTADGRLAASWLSEGNDLRHFARGMYLVKVGSQTMKVAVK